MADEEMPRLENNEAAWDRALRIVLGLAVLALGIYGSFAEGPAMAMRIASLYPLLTGALGWCPLYAGLGVDTRKTRVVELHPHGSR